MSRLLARLRGQTSWYNNATDRLAMEIRQASQARHQATVEREKRQLERLEGVEASNISKKSEDSSKMEVPRPNSGELLTYYPPNEPKAAEDEAQETSQDPLGSFPRLPRKKLRALVRLYNQSESWLTPETLDRHIEQEFALNQEFRGHVDISYLRREAERKNTLPEMTTEGLNPMRAVGSTRKRILRRDTISGALWGIDESGNPDLEALEEINELEREQAEKTK
ncbi:hypothetical protein FRC17_004777 [Serendipita sp. 399]|nr:hypothetical protein FRC17_004777 [Serendipita sp. 399]